MNLWQNYYIPRELPDALNALEEAPDSSKIIAGGTDLLLDIRQGRHLPVHTLIDVTEIPELKKIEIRGNELFIGSAVTHKRIAESKLVIKHCTALAMASGLIGGPQVRNLATIGGNVAHALPAADGTIALLALHAQAEIFDRKGYRRVALVELFKGPGISTMDPKSDILTGFYIKLRAPGTASSFGRIMRPQGVAIAILNMAVWLHCVGETIEDVHIVVGPSGPTPRRIQAAEKILCGKSLTPEVISVVHEALLEGVSLRTSRFRSTQEYRKLMSKVLLDETLTTAYQLSVMNDQFPVN